MSLEAHIGDTLATIPAHLSVDSIGLSGDKTKGQLKVDGMPFIGQNDTPWQPFE